MLPCAGRPFIFGLSDSQLERLRPDVRRVPCGVVLGAVRQAQARERGGPRGRGRPARRADVYTTSPPEDRDDASPTAVRPHLVCFAPLAAQPDLTFSVGAGVAAGVPVGDFADEDIKTGVGFTLDGRLHFTPMFAVYGEFARFKFDVDTGEPGVNADITDKVSPWAAKSGSPPRGSSPPYYG
jgi:hypothetical protein